MSKKASTKKTRSAHATHEQRLQDKKKIQLEESKEANTKYYTIVSEWVDETDDSKFNEVEELLRKIKKIHQSIMKTEQKIVYHQKKQEVSK